jgi:hypothetical protein
MQVPGTAGRDGFGPDAAHLLRTTPAIQHQLSQMADQKANMVLAITFVIFSPTLGQAQGGAAPPLPLLVMGVAAFIAATLAVMAAPPSVRESPPKSDGSTNILFFGSFSQLSQAEFTERLLDSLGDNRAVFETWGPRYLPERSCAGGEEVPAARLCLPGPADRALRQRDGLSGPNRDPLFPGLKILRILTFSSQFNVLP